jgi:hypothetical protein
MLNDPGSPMEDIFQTLSPTIQGDYLMRARGDSINDSATRAC